MDLGILQASEAVVPQVRTSAETYSPRWGWLPVLSVTNALSLFLIAYSYNGNRNNATWASALFWLSLLFMFAPSALRLTSPFLARRERLGIIILVALSLYLVKVFQTPLAFTFHDEFLHWRTASDIVKNNHLFTGNYILPVSAFYPGMEIITSALANLSGLSIYACGMILIGLARLILAVAMYLFFERVSRSEQIGGIAALLYMTNSNFLFFDSQFSYESLALPIAMTVLYVVTLRHNRQDFPLSKLIILAIPLTFALAATHHMTTYVLIGFLFLWAVVAYWGRRGHSHWFDVVVIAIVTVLATTAWTYYVGASIAGYLVPVFRNGLIQLAQLITNENTGRELFQSATGQASPLWEQVVGIGSVVFILLMLPVGLFRTVVSPFGIGRPKGMVLLRSGALRAWHIYRHNASAFALAVIVVAHPIMLAFRFTSAGWEIANRSSEFVFWGVAFILAVGFIQLHDLWLPRWVWSIGFVIWIGVIFAGGAISGWPPWARLPGPYIVSADARSIEPQGIGAAQWAKTYLNAGYAMASDRINTLLMAAYGDQNMITHLDSGTYTASVFFSPQIGPVEKDIITRTRLRYITVDERLSTALPMVGVYFEAGEPNGNNYTSPPPLSALQKFNQIANVNRIFDGGSIKVYDLKALGTP